MVKDVKMLIIPDSDELSERKLKHAEGTYIGDILFYVKASEYGERPEVGGRIDYDGKQYRIADFAEDSGMYTVTLEANL